MERVVSESLTEVLTTNGGHRRDVLDTARVSACALRPGAGARSVREAEPRAGELEAILATNKEDRVHLRYITKTPKNLRNWSYTRGRNSAPDEGTLLYTTLRT